MNDNYYSSINKGKDNTELREQVLNVLKEHNVRYSYRRGWVAIDSPLLEYVLPPIVMAALAVLPIKGVCARINKNDGRPFIAIYY